MQQTNDTTTPIYAQGTLDFVTVAAEFCAFLEQSSGRSKEQFVDTMLKLLPYLYMKATMVQRIESNGDFLPDDKVTEEDYNWIRNIIYSIMGNDDDYEELMCERNSTPSSRILRMPDKENTWKPPLSVSIGFCHDEN